MVFWLVINDIFCRGKIYEYGLACLRDPHYDEGQRKCWGEGEGGGDEGEREGVLDVFYVFPEVFCAWRWGSKCVQEIGSVLTTTP